ncbi:hypothetical protein P8C59_005092 [Phyllachora maydis]|nr:hypothetical protein P8C59_005092 [Phyllachora maydis]
MPDSVPQFFATVVNPGGVVVQETPKLDLDLYIQNYRGRTRFERLLHIGRTSVPLCVEALKSAVHEAKRGRDVQRYRDAWECIRSAAPSEPEAIFDRIWAEQAEKANKAETARLETELKGYKNNLIKESIRIGHEELGKHLESIGDLDGAADAYGKMRPDVSTPKHLVDVHRHIVSVAIQRREWGTVAANVTKMQGQQSSDDEKHIQPYMRIAMGLCLLGQGKFDEAACHFLEPNPTIPQTTWSDLASPNDVATYGGLLALASMDRANLQAKLLDNSSFRNFLEAEPQIRRAITQFVNGRYSQCIATLESYRADCLLDIHLHKHVPKIYSEIRVKCIVQYLVPFSCVTLDKMRENFGRPGEAIEEELAAMIEAGSVDVRINLTDKFITKTSTSVRAKTQTAALETIKNYEKEAIDRLRRMSLMSADLE